jgi:hypothetical protein
LKPDPAELKLNPTPPGDASRREPTRVSPGLDPASAPKYQRHNEKHQEYEKQNLGDTGRRNRDTAESKDRCNNRDNQKYQGPIEHGYLR